MKEPKGSPIPIRFDAEETEMLKRISDTTRLPQAQIVRLAVKHFLAEVKRTGSLPMSLDLSSFGNSASGRSEPKSQKTPGGQQSGVEQKPVLNALVEKVVQQVQKSKGQV